MVAGGGALGSGQERIPGGILNAFSMAQPASQVGRGLSGGSIQQRGQLLASAAYSGEQSRAWAW